MLMERCRYDKIRSLYIGQLAHAWMEDSTAETTRASVEKKIDSFIEEGLEHATEMLSALWETANKDDDVQVSANTSSPVRPFQFCLLRVMHDRLLHITRPHRSRAPPVGPL